VIPIRTRWTLLLFPDRTRMSLAPTYCRKSIQKLLDYRFSDSNTVEATFLFGGGFPGRRAWRDSFG